MYTTYHLKNVSELNNDILEAIKAAFRDKPIVLTVEEEIDETAFLSSNPINKAMLLKSIAEDKNGASITVKIPEA